LGIFSFVKKVKKKNYALLFTVLFWGENNCAKSPKLPLLHFSASLATAAALMSDISDAVNSLLS
jgi:hypothetical protein